ncbi:hypothetical protein BDA99DRAFT_492493 [Phascolomyces articulosus]|uniref:AMP-dependent synthetase/ligase domain-containing protein n=1 Tax=Phascolomyces articulosus TaxID=60185 RepID=A0AAD5KRT7_9FUNG|nr:hypothetical protein BDA99DRAFT_492493 [Phascolomyces articulosus]
MITSQYDDDGHSDLPNYTDFDSLLQVFETFSARHQDKVFIRYQIQPNSQEYRTLTYGQVNTIATYLADTWNCTILQNDDMGHIQRKQQKPCLIILNDDPVQSILTFFATLKLNLIYFPLATHDSDTAITYFLEKTSPRYLIISKTMRSKAQRCIPPGSTIQIKIWDEQLNIEKIIATNNVAVSVQLQPRSGDMNMNMNMNMNKLDGGAAVGITTKNDPSSTVAYMHTSGSTSLLPKLVEWSTQLCMYSTCEILLKSIQNSNVRMESSDVLLIPILLMTGPDIDFILATMMMGSSIVAFHNNTPRPFDLLAASKIFHATLILASPYTLEGLAEYLMQKQDNDTVVANFPSAPNNTTKKFDLDHKISVFEQFKCCITFGAALRTSIGCLLQSKGLNVQTLYGATEIDNLCISDVSKENQEHWNCLRPSGALTQYSSFEPYQDGINKYNKNTENEDVVLYQLIIHNDHPVLPKSVRNRPNGDFATGDLFVHHQEARNNHHEPCFCWKLVGRIDDTFKTSLGEKVIPKPMEMEICNEEIIRNCILVGENREYTAVLVELDLDKAQNYTESERTLRVYEAVRRANSYALYYAIVLVPDFVYILPFDKQLPTTRKKQVSRKKAIAMFKEEIEQLYNHHSSRNTTSI